MNRIIPAALGAAAIAFACWSGTALAQAKGKEAKGTPAIIKVILENDKVRVTETTYMASAINTTTKRNTYRVVRALTGGTLERTYPDGKKEQVTYKTGDVHVNEPSAQYTTQNIGTKPMQLYTVEVK